MLNSPKVGRFIPGSKYLRKISDVPNMVTSQKKINMDAQDGQDKKLTAKVTYFMDL